MKVKKSVGFGIASIAIAISYAASSNIDSKQRQSTKPVVPQITYEQKVEEFRAKMEDSKARCARFFANKPDSISGCQRHAELTFEDDVYNLSKPDNRYTRAFDACDRVKNDNTAIACSNFVRDSALQDAGL